MRLRSKKPQMARAAWRRAARYFFWFRVQFVIANTAITRWHSAASRPVKRKGKRQ
jgi:hypothetical protein